jgi:hypothetical protein
MKEKKFRLRADQIRPLAPNRGGCLATDMITVDGRPVGFMYREKPDNEVDSGWRFLSGLESDEYMKNPENHAAFDVNTIANFDPSIISLLDSAVGSEFARDEDSGKLVCTTNDS